MSNEPKLVTGHFVEGVEEDEGPLPLALRRTKAYAKKLLKDIPPSELVQLVTQQAQVIILALGEHTLKLIEELDVATDTLTRAALQSELELTMQRSGDMARKKNELIAAFGHDPTAAATDEDGRPIAALAKTTIGKDQFESMFSSLNPFASVQDAEFDKAHEFVKAVLTPEEKADLDRTIKDAASNAADRIRRRLDDKDKLN